MSRLESLRAGQLGDPLLKAAGTLDEQTYKSSRQRLLDALLQ